MVPVVEPLVQSF